MPIDREALKNAAATAQARRRERAPTGVASMVAGIHKGPLAAFVSLESVALPPVPVVRDGAWQVVALLAVPAGPGEGLQAPWGAVTWHADGRVAATHRLDGPAETGVYRVPAAGWRALFAALDGVLAGPVDAELSALAPRYAALLPEAVRPVVHAVVPETRSWLP